MNRNMFAQYAKDLKQLGANGVGVEDFSLGENGKYRLQYTPFEHVNREARLVIVGITPGNNQLDLAYGKAQELLWEGWPEGEILAEIKKAGAFGGSAMKPNLLKMLRHFYFEKILDIDDVDSLWGDNARLLHSTSTVPHAAFKAGKMFAGSFNEVMASPLLRECFTDCFVPSAEEMNKDAFFIGLGPCPQAALEWCVQEGVLSRKQVLGAFCHPATTGGSTVKYYLREVTKDVLKPADPVRNRTEWLDKAYEQMLVYLMQRRWHCQRASLNWRISGGALDIGVSTTCCAPKGVTRTTSACGGCIAKQSYQLSGARRPNGRWVSVRNYYRRRARMMCGVLIS